MSSSFLTGAARRIGVRAIYDVPRTSALQLTRAASLNSAIGKGLRKSKGVGFRGKERFQEKERLQERISAFEGKPREAIHALPQDRLVRRTADPPPSAFAKVPLTKHGLRRLRDSVSDEKIVPQRAPDGPRLRMGKRVIKDDHARPKSKSRAARYHDPNLSFGRKSQLRRASLEASKQYSDGGSSPDASTERKSPRDYKSKSEYDDLRASRDRGIQSSMGFEGKQSSWKAGQDTQSAFQSDRYDRNADQEDRRGSVLSSSRKRAADSDGTALQQNPEGMKISSSRRAYLERGSTSSRPGHDQPTSYDRQPYRSNGNQDSFTPSRERYGSPQLNNTTPPGVHREHDGPVSRRTFTQTVDNRIPLSIPYTTPASEFLYGTSVVEAAMHSKRHPRRKLYKLYIFTGENRDSENATRDANIARLARRNGVEVVHVGNDWLRLMDKMSAGRPHNGYILEASPLPKLPVTSLGELSAQNSMTGYKVSLDHQSREEAAVNGTDNFIPIPFNPSGHKPFVLLLDSIVDPGNLGGIIRTASFLGVTAIAISTRNSASFTPVVLKASAGASENITLFSVNKPAGFITDSRAAGWKIYAAVAPTVGNRNSKGNSSLTPNITTDELADPLASDPCILMMGNEGEGLRWNLRSKADVELAIQGSSHAAGVDSLNVSVATGILCHAFLRQAGTTLAKAGEGKNVANTNLF